MSYLLSRNLQIDNVHRTTVKAVFKDDVFTGAEIYFDYGIKGKYSNDIYVIVTYDDASRKFALDAIMIDIGTGSQSLWQRK